MSALNFLTCVIIAYAINTRLSAYGAAIPLSSTDSFDDLIPSIDSKLKESHEGITWTLVRQISHTVPVTEPDEPSEMTELSSEPLFEETTTLLNLSELEGFSGNQLSDPDSVQSSEVYLSEDSDQIPEDLFDMIPKDRIFSDVPHIQISIDSNSLANQVNISNLHNNSHDWDSVVEMNPEDDSEHSIPVDTVFPKSNESLIPVESEHFEKDVQAKISIQFSEPEVLPNTDSVELNDFKVHTESDDLFKDPELNSTFVDLTHDSKDPINSVERSNNLEQVDAVTEGKYFEKFSNGSNVQGNIDMASNSTVKTKSDKATESDILTEDSNESEIREILDINDSDVLINDSEANDSFAEFANDSVVSKDSTDDIKDSELQSSFLNNSSDLEVRTDVVNEINDLEESTGSSTESNTEVATDSVEISKDRSTIPVDREAHFEGNSSDLPGSDFEVNKNESEIATVVSESMDKLPEVSPLRDISTDEVVDVVETSSASNTSNIPISKLNESSSSPINLAIPTVSTSTQVSDFDHGSILNANISSQFENGIIAANNEIIISGVNVTSNENLVSETKNDTEIVLSPECPAPGFCILWFMAQDACSMNSDCQRPTICCTVGCAKSCVEV